MLRRASRRGKGYGFVAVQHPLPVAFSVGCLLILHRPIDPARDEARLRTLDISVTSDRIYRVHTASDGFSLEVVECSTPVIKRYPVEWHLLSRADSCVVAEEGERLIGFGAMTVERWNRRATIQHLYVDRPERGRGVGAGLLSSLRSSAALAGARCLWVETQNVNLRAVRFYERHGFTLCGLDAALYDPLTVPDETALFFVAPLDA